MTFLNLTEIVDNRKDHEMLTFFIIAAVTQFRLITEKEVPRDIAVSIVEEGQEFDVRSVLEKFSTIWDNRLKFETVKYGTNSFALFLRGIEDHANHRSLLEQGKPEMSDLFYALKYGMNSKKSWAQPILRIEGVDIEFTDLFQRLLDSWEKEVYRFAREKIEAWFFLQDSMEE